MEQAKTVETLRAAVENARDCLREVGGMLDVLAVDAAGGVAGAAVAYCLQWLADVCAGGVRDIDAAIGEGVRGDE